MRAPFIASVLIPSQGGGPPVFTLRDISFGDLTYSFVDAKTGLEDNLLFFVDPAGSLTDQLLAWLSQMRWDFNSKRPLPALFVSGMIKVC